MQNIMIKNNSDAKFSPEIQSHVSRLDARTCQLNVFNKKMQRAVLPF